MLTGNLYECAYADFNLLRYMTMYDDSVADILKESTEAISPAEINVHLRKKLGYSLLLPPYSFAGEEKYFMSPQKMGSILSHMKLVGCVEVVKEPYGDPITYIKKEKVWVDPTDEPHFIDVTDTRGRQFTIINPMWDPDTTRGHYEWKMVEHTIQPTRNLYKWVRA